jgi:hypothetical protein
VEYLLKNCLFIGALSSVVVTSMSSAAIITFTTAAAFGLSSNNEGTSVFTENFDDLEGFYSNPLTGDMGGTTWSATAFGGLFVGQVSSSPALSTAYAVPLTIEFTGNDVYGVSGNFFATNQDFSVVGNIVKITISDGTVHTGYVNSSSAFLGFYSTGAAITSITLSLPWSFGFAYPTIDNMSIATIPAPSALALIGLAGFSRRRRR